MNYEVDWTQFFSLIIAFIAYVGVIWAMFTFWAPWPITSPLIAIATVASGAWSHRYSLHMEGEANRPR